MDWGLFHVEQDFFYHWQAYKKILSQRNAALRNAKPNSEIKVWDASLNAHGLKLATYRNEYLDQLVISFKEWFMLLCNDYKTSKFELRYLSGWPKGEDFADILNKTIDRDRALGYTRSGPHAADWSLRVDGQDPAELFSRGQQKLFFLAISLAQITLMQQINKQQSVLLIDDLSSELDREHQVSVLQAIKKLKVQTFITTTNTELSARLVKEENDIMFHVERGVIEQV